MNKIRYKINYNTIWILYLTLLKRKELCDLDEFRIEWSPFFVFSKFGRSLLSNTYIEAKKQTKEPTKKKWHLIFNFYLLSIHFAWQSGILITEPLNFNVQLITIQWWYFGIAFAFLFSAFFFLLFNGTFDAVERNHSWWMQTLLT